MYVCKSRLLPITPPENVARQQRYRNNGIQAASGYVILSSDPITDRSVFRFKPKSVENKLIIKQIKEKGNAKNILKDKEINVDKRRDQNNRYQKKLFNDTNGGR